MTVTWPIKLDGSEDSSSPSAWDVTTRAGKGAKINAVEHDNGMIALREAANELKTAVEGKEPQFSKNTAHNKDFASEAQAQAGESDNTVMSPEGVQQFWDWRTAKDNIVVNPTLDLDFENQVYRSYQGPAGLTRFDFDDRITITRATAATYFNAMGLLATAASGEPRIDYDPVTGECLSLFVEESRTNLLLYSRDLNNAAWTKTNCSAAKDAVGIDGAANSASTLTASAVDATCLQAITSASAARATTAYVKRKTGTGAVYMTQDGGTTWEEITISNTAWTRVGPASATVTNPSVGFKIAVSGDEILVDYVQCETGGHSTSAILTEGAQATRNADQVSMSGANFSDWYRQGVGTVVCEGRGEILCTLYNIHGGSANNRISSFFASTSGQFLFRSTVSGVNECSNTHTGVPMSPIFIRTAFALEADNFASVVDGGAIVGDSSGGVPVGLTTINIGSNVSNAAQLNGHIKRIRYWPERLSNETLQALTR